MDEIRSGLRFIASVLLRRLQKASLAVLVMNFSTLMPRFEFRVYFSKMMFIYTCDGTQVKLQLQSQDPSSSASSISHRR